MADGLASPVLVVAPRLREAELWARARGLQHAQWRFARSPDDLLGLHHGTVVLVNVHQLPGLAAWEAELRVLEVTGTVVKQVYT